MHKLHHKDAVYPFACTSCEYNAPNQQNLLSHLKLHADEKPYPCHICSYRAKNRTGINAHLKRKNHAAIRSVRVNYRCRMCNHETSNPSDLRSHIVTQHIRLPNLIRFELVCMCQYVTKFEEIPIHINDHAKNLLHTDADKLLIYFVCNVVEDDGQDENQYTQVDIPNVPHSSVPLSYNSNYPGNIQGFSEYNWFQNSTPNPHSSMGYTPQPPVVNNLPPIHTINASNTFQTNTASTNDAMCYYPNTYQAPTPPPSNTSIKVTVDLTCTLCGHYALNDSDLNHHVSTAHSTVVYDQETNMPVSFECRICPFKGDTETELMLHMTTHVAVKYDEAGPELIEYICDICGYTTYSDSELVVHRLTHNDIPETSECSLCGYKACSSFDLRLHMILHSQAEEQLDSDSEGVRSPFMVNSYEQQDMYGNCQPLQDHQEQFAAQCD